MAEAVSKAGMFSPFSAVKKHQIQHRHAPSSFNCKSPLFSSGMGFPSVRLRPTALATSSNTNFLGRRFLIQRHQITPRRANSQFFTISQMSIGIGKAQKWWEKGLQPNMKEVKGAQDLVESLLNAGDKLVVVDFFSPGCGGCKALHPKICQLAEMNPDVQFLQVNYEEHKSMCYTLHVHVLPFFRFYRGADGRLCSFSCTNATIKKFKDALAKHSPQRCSLGPPKGLEEKELLALSANKDLSFNYAPKPEQPVPTPAQEKILAEEVVSAAASPSELDHPLPLPRPLQSSGSLKAAQDYEEKSLVSSSR